MDIVYESGCVSVRMEPHPDVPITKDAAEMYRFSHRFYCKDISPFSIAKMSSFFLILSHDCIIMKALNKHSAYKENQLSKMQRRHL